MPSPLARQILYAGGGDVLSKYGTLNWRKTPPTRGGEIPYTFTRTGTGLYLANDVAAGGLKVFTAASGKVRIEQLIDPVNLVLQNYLKLEPAATNFLLQSQTWATGPWGAAAATITNAAATAPDGTTTAVSVVPDGTSTGIHGVQQVIGTITAGEFYSVSCFLQANGYNFYRIKVDNGGNGIAAYGDLSLGTITGVQLNTGTLSGQSIIPLAGGWCWIGVWGKTGGVATSVTVNILAYDTLAHAQNEVAWTGNTVSGIRGWGGQFERNGTVGALPPTSYVATTVAAATRNAEAFSVPWFIRYADMAPFWVYCRHLERGTALGDAGNFGRLWGFGTYPTGSIEVDGSQSGKTYGVNHSEPGPVSVGSAPGGSPAFGDVVETLAFIFGDGSVQLRRSYNVAADVVGSRSSALAFTAVPANAFALNSDASGGSPGCSLLSRVVVGRGVPTGIADVRNTL